MTMKIYTVVSEVLYADSNFRRKEILFREMVNNIIRGVQNILV
jgi:hypothetical protein